MAKFHVTYAYYKIVNGRATGKTSTSRTVEATSDFMAVEIIKGKHSGYEIEIRKIEQK
ncbi:MULTISPECIES: hypothetical protein [Acinetobacter]|uniref:hypothetical protein n=1 Tax=Acinetobacter TaxID=469 RepID=UPI0012DB3D80|nr:MULTISPECIES: hypothetical protein [unclassified Acinetobacter]WEE37514.1 hypothetical protein PYV58_11180 [Acinetobacter sp. TAC-1]